MEIKIPPHLVKGDTVAIVCTARKFSKEEAKPAIALLKSWGLNVLLGDTIGLDNFQLGGTDEERVADFNKQLANPEVKAIWCARGGYGTVRIIDKIDFSLMRKHPKWLVGFSDVTTLHSHLNTCGFASIHGIMAFSVPNTSEEAKETLHKSLFGEPLKYSLPADPLNREGIAKAELVGGNLSILYSLLGSDSSIDTKNKILFIEDLDEYLYHIDRMMHNLKRNNKLSDLKGLIVGGMTDMHDNSIPFGYTAEQIILELVKEYDFPVVFNFPAGHVKNNLALKLGETVVLDVTKQGTTLEFISNESERFR